MRRDARPGARQPARAVTVDILFVSWSADQAPQTPERQAELARLFDSDPVDGRVDRCRLRSRAAGDSPSRPRPAASVDRRPHLRQRRRLTGGTLDRGSHRSRAIGWTLGFRRPRAGRDRPVRWRAGWRTRRRGAAGWWCTLEVARVAHRTATNSSDRAAPRPAVQLPVARGAAHHRGIDAPSAADRLGHGSATLLRPSGMPFARRCETPTLTNCQEVSVDFTVNGDAGVGARRPPAPAGRAARGARRHLAEGRLLAVGPVRLLHGAGRRQGRRQLPAVAGQGGRQVGRHARGRRPRTSATASPRRSPPAAACSAASASPAS